MRDNYQFTINASNLLGLQYYIEEIEGGFLIFYKRKGDFLAAQLDRSNPTEIKDWILSKRIDPNHPAIIELVELMKNFEKMDKK
ncbi:hypothetical protein NEF87_002197 [Candidatus Lokiarchaeum ossiferum]|uniref:DUF5659 domain-containing protein n=1 Tax=Candidatus Lokiarchaeum ossiferum TaxID=2951803 RepID=A0ABY6HSS4_9ARCH|nr:hypothetical protein NEF87_002197 [Candidatus Lokiarchaeum sp. B-35]